MTATSARHQNLNQCDRKDDEFFGTLRTGYTVRFEPVKGIANIFWRGRSRCDGRGWSWSWRQRNLKRLITWTLSAEPVDFVNLDASELEVLACQSKRVVGLPNFVGRLDYHNQTLAVAENVLWVTLDGEAFGFEDLVRPLQLRFFGRIRRLRR
jgi:hypothetical protein